jgi:glycosyltransferase involved in cell wall biosynthesis
VGLTLAVLHEWVNAYDGSVQVFEALAHSFPSADLYALSRTPGVALDLGGRPLRTTWLDRPGLRDRREFTLPLMPLAWRTLRTPQYDTVLTSHHAFAHTNRLSGTAGRHLAYVHAPARYLWTPDIDGRGDRWFLAAPKAALRRVDLRATRRVHAYAANSTAIARRLEQFWDRPSTVIHPPVRTAFYGAAPDAPVDRGYVLGVGRWVPYKQLHLVIEAADRAGMPVKVAGRGPDKSRLVAAAAAAKVPVELVENPTDVELRELYRGATCLVFPTVEDFGMVPVEAMAAGTPVIAFAAGGALDTIEDGVSGLLVQEQTVPALVDALSRATALSPDAARTRAGLFSEAVFRARIQAWVAHEGAG